MTACYDTINQPMLFDMIQRVFQEEEYLIQKYNVLFAKEGRILAKFKSW